MVIKLEILYKNLIQNIKVIRSHFLNKKIYAVVKSNAYNHGVNIVVPLMINEGINDYCVSNISEAIELRAHSDDINILLLGRVNIDHIKYYKDYNITISLSNIDDYKIILRNKLDYQMCVNTGMNRYGLSISESKVILDYHDCYLKGIYTHLGSSEVRDRRYRKQCKTFKELLCKYDTSNIDVHISNSSDTFSTDNDFDAIRIGMLFYNGVTTPLSLLNTMSVKGSIVNIIDVKANEYIGYYKTKKLRLNKRIGVVNIGYEKGILNSFGIRYIRINNKKYKVIGKICMNNMFVVLDDTVKIGEIVEVVGDLNNIKTIAKTANISSYEVLLNLKK